MTLDDFLDALSECPEFEIRQDGRLRSKSLTSPLAMEGMCPLCAVVYMTQGVRLPNDMYKEAAVRLDLDHDAYEIAGASDGILDLPLRDWIIDAANIA